MTTIKKIKKELGKQFTNQIVSIDHNVGENYDQEFSIHIVCHPIISSSGDLKIDGKLREEIKKISSKHTVSRFGSHVHISAEISKDVLNIGQDDLEQKIQGEL